MTLPLLDKLPPEKLAALRVQLSEALARKKLFSLFPDEGPLRRELYPKHIAFLKAGATFQERAFIAANRIGKTTAAGYELACHLTGEYPDWWEGARFTRPIVAWACGEDAKAMRESVQPILVGFPVTPMGTGLIPGDSIVGDPTKRAGVPEGLDTIVVRHKSGGLSRLVFKTYDQGRESYQGAKVDFVWYDEEPPQPIYSEGLARTMATVPGEQNGKVVCTFTPLKGLSAVVLLYLPGGRVPDKALSRFIVMASWADVPHLDETAKAQLLSAFLPHERDARSKGIPQLGSGAIYPIAEEELLCAPFELPQWYRFAYALDVGWNRTAAIWGALNPETDVLYLYNEYYRGQVEPAVHAQAIKAPGAWIPGVIDPASRGRSQNDGQQLLTIYTQLGLSLSLANNAVESGLYEVWSRMSSGRLKVFNTLPNWLMEFRIYRRDDKGKVVKDNDHLMDTTRYLIMSGLARARQKPFEAASIPRRSRHTFEYDPMAEAYKIPQISTSVH